MKYGKRDAKAFARANMKGIWAAALTPFAPDLSIDEAGFRSNLRHWVDDLGIDGVFVCGKQGEFFSMSVAERKRTFEIAVDAIGRTRRHHHVVLRPEHGRGDRPRASTPRRSAPTTSSCTRRCCISCTAQDETLYEYYKTISEQVDIGIAMWSHPDCGYLMSPELCARIAELPNIVAIKYSVPREMYVRLTRLAGDKIIVSTASEEEWFDNIVELGWQLYLCSSPPYLFQTKVDRRMREYTDLAFHGEVARAKAVRDSLDPVRQAFRRTRPPEKPHAHSKYWQELLGQVGGAVRRPMLELTEAEKETIRRAFETLRAQAADAAPTIVRGLMRGDNAMRDRTTAGLQLQEMDRREPASAEAAGRQQEGVRGRRHDGAGGRRPEPALPTTTTTRWRSSSTSSRATWCSRSATTAISTTCRSRRATCSCCRRMCAIRRSGRRARSASWSSRSAATTRWTRSSGTASNAARSCTASR